MELTKRQQRILNATAHLGDDEPFFVIPASSAIGAESVRDFARRMLAQGRRSAPDSPEYPGIRKFADAAFDLANSMDLWNHEQDINRKKLEIEAGLRRGELPGGMRVEDAPENMVLHEDPRTLGKPTFDRSILDSVPEAPASDPPPAARPRPRTRRSTPVKGGKPTVKKHVR